MTMQIKDMGLREYADTYAAMRNFSERRQKDTTDQIWLLEHLSVYTLGLSAREEHVLDTGNIPVIKTDRGGQVTYHGPGQLVVYLLIDLNKRPYTIKKLVLLIEETVIAYLQNFNIRAERNPGAPGVYIRGKKIAALGLRVRKGRTYHGLAFNINMDLEPFKGIHPCGHADIECTRLANFVENITVKHVKANITDYLLKYLDQSSALYQ